MQHPISFGKFFIVELHAGFTVSYIQNHVNITFILKLGKKTERKRKLIEILPAYHFNVACMTLELIFFCVWVVYQCLCLIMAVMIITGVLRFSNFFSFFSSCFIAIEKHCFVIQSRKWNHKIIFLYHNWKKFLTIIKKRFW